MREVTAGMVALTAAETTARLHPLDRHNSTLVVVQRWWGRATIPVFDIDVKLPSGGIVWRLKLSKEGNLFEVATDLGGEHAVEVRLTDLPEPTLRCIRDALLAAS